MLHITESMAAAGGGTSTAFLELIESLRARPGEVSVHAVTRGLAAGDESLLRIAGHEKEAWTFTGPPGKLTPGAMFSSALEAMTRLRPDVLVAHGLWCTDIVALSRVAQSRGIATVYHPHGMLVREALSRSGGKKWVFKVVAGLPAVLRSARAVVFATEGEVAGSDLSMLTRRGKGPRRVVIPLAVKMEVGVQERAVLRAAGRTALGLPEGAPVVVFVGRLHPVKRVDLTLRAFAEAAKRVAGGEARLVLVGEGEAEYTAGLRTLAGELGISESVVFAGWLSGQAKWRALAAADALIINSEFENFCYALVEALIAGTPVVMTDNLAMAAAAVKAGGGVMAAGEPGPLGVALSGVLGATEQARREMGERGRAWVEGNFGRVAVGGALVKLYREVVEG